METKKDARKRLEPLVGHWNIEIVWPTDPPMRITGRASIEWLPGNFFLIYRSEIDHPDFPKTESIIGCDDRMETYSMLYSDSRGIARLYNMSLTESEWKLWRDDLQFLQRFVGTLSTDHRTLTGSWENSTDGISWQHDFELTYRKI